MPGLGPFRSYFFRRVLLLTGQVQGRVGLIVEFVGVSPQGIITVIRNKVSDTIKKVVLLIHIELSVLEVSCLEQRMLLVIIDVIILTTVPRLAINRRD